MDQSHIKRQLGNLHTLLQFIDGELANYLCKPRRSFDMHVVLCHLLFDRLAENNSSNMYFFFRWMLICFKREFSFDDVMHLWEVNIHQTPFADLFHSSIAGGMDGSSLPQLRPTHLPGNSSLSENSDHGIEIRLQ